MCSMVLSFRSDGFVSGQRWSGRFNEWDMHQVCACMSLFRGNTGVGDLWKCDVVYGLNDESHSKKEWQ